MQYSKCGIMSCVPPCDDRGTGTKPIGPVAPLCVAIVEDERDLVELYVRLLTMRHMQVGFIAHDGCRAVELFSGSKQDVILIDHRMPTMSGIEAMKRMLAVDPRAKFIFLSADDDIKDKALESGAKIFLKKPASIKELESAILQAYNSS